jgi:hypothetical protein
VSCLPTLRKSTLDSAPRPSKPWPPPLLPPHRHPRLLQLLLPLRGVVSPCRSRAQTASVRRPVPPHSRCHPPRALLSPPQLLPLQEEGGPDFRHHSILNSRSLGDPQRKTMTIWPWQTQCQPERVGSRHSQPWRPPSPLRFLALLRGLLPTTTGEGRVLEVGPRGEHSPMPFCSLRPELVQEGA